MLGYALLIAATIILLLMRKRWRRRTAMSIGWPVRVGALILLHAGIVLVLLNADDLNPRADLIPYLWTTAGLMLFTVGLGAILAPRGRY